MSERTNYGGQSESCGGEGERECLRKSNWNGRNAAYPECQIIQCEPVQDFRARTFERGAGNPQPGDFILQGACCGPAKHYVFYIFSALRANATSRVLTYVVTRQPSGSR